MAYQNLILQIVGITYLLFSSFQTIAQDFTYRWLFKGKESHFNRLMDSGIGVEFSLVEGGIISIPNVAQDSLFILESQDTEENNMEGELEKYQRALRYIFYDDTSAVDIQPDYKYSLMYEPNDPGFTQQTYINHTQQGSCVNGIDINAKNAWEYTKGSEDIIVAVLDGGVDLDHEDLENNLWKNIGEWGLDSRGMDKATNGLDDDGNGFIDDIHGWNFVDNDNEPEDRTKSGHGTHVAGIIGAVGDNDLGITGISWRSKIMPLKFTDKDGHGFTSDAIRAIYYVIAMNNSLSTNQKIVAINCSWGGGNYDINLKAAIEAANSAGILMITAAGNVANNNNDIYPFYPASYDVENIISVAATDCEGRLTSFSCYGSNTVDIAAPGEAIYSTLPQSMYGPLTGTSMAAPQVTGAIALMSAKINENHIGLKNSLLQHAQSIPDLIGSVKDGAFLNIGDVFSQKTGLEIHSPQLESSERFLLVEDRERNIIWIIDRATNELIKNNIDDESIDSFSLPSSIDSPVIDMVITSNGFLWLNTSNALYSYDPESYRWELEIENSEFGDKEFKDLNSSSQDDIWLVIGDHDLIKNPHDIKPKDKTLAFPDGKIEKVVINDQTAYVIVNFGPAGNHLIKSESVEKKSTTLIPNHTRNIGVEEDAEIVLDPQGKLWLRERTGLSNFFKGSWTYFQSHIVNPVDWNSVNSMNIDHNGLIWLGTQYSSIIQYNSKNLTWHHYDNLSDNTSSSINPIYDILTDTNGDLWTHYQDDLMFKIQKVAIAVSASFTMNHNSICPNQEISFTNTSAIVDSSFWYIDGDSIRKGRNFSYRFVDAREYQVELRNFQYSRETSYIRHIKVVEPITFDLGPDTTTVLGVIYLDPDLPDMQSYTWLEEGVEVPIGETKDITITQNGNYILEAIDHCQNTIRDTINIVLENNERYVLPGDVNKDGKINGEDAIRIGTVEGEVGIPRASGFISQPEECDSWGRSLPPYLDIDLRNADTDGEGTIEISNDATIVLNNVNSVHPTNYVTSDFSLAATMELTPRPNDIIDIEFVFSSRYANLLDSVYGFAISVYLNQVLRNKPVMLDLPTLLGQPGVDVYQNFIFDSVENRIDFIFTRYDRSPPPARSSLSRTFGRGCTITIIDDIDTTESNQHHLASEIPLTYTLGNVFVIDKDGNTLPVNPINSQSTHTFMVPAPSSNSAALIASERFSISEPNSPESLTEFSSYPNPVTNILNIEVTLDESAKMYIELFDLSGRLLKSRIEYFENGRNLMNWRISDLPKGMYFIRLRNDYEQFYHQKILKQ